MPYDVELTKEETAAAIHSAKEKKFWKLDDERKVNEKQAALREIGRPWDADEMLARATKRATELAKDFVMDEYALPVFQLLSWYFTGDKRFEEAKFSFKKGLLILGQVGVGKTDILQAFEINKIQCFHTVSCSAIQADVKKKGIDSWQTFGGYVPGWGHRTRFFNQPHIGWMFDDMGTETVINDFGTKLDIIPTIIQDRYKNKDKLPFNSLHMTTNLSGEMIEARYDYRLRSRIREMFNVIEYKGVDRRK